MRIIPAVAGAVMVTGLALWVGTGGATVPTEPPATEPAVSTPGHAPDHARSGKPPKPDKAEKSEKSGTSEKSDEDDKGKARGHDKGKARGHDKGKARGHDKVPPPHAQGRKPRELVPQPPGRLKKGEACFGHARYEGGRLEPCPWKPHPHGKVVPAGPRPYSETEE